ncbi:cytochrome P450 3A24-like protein [Aphelenchoides avenae]|nr:cytochrome P450 3A24-like protein [Aphelenchus avenae]
MATLGTGDRLLIVLMVFAVVFATLPTGYSIAISIAFLAAALGYFWYDRTYWQRHGIPTPRCSALFDNTYYMLKDGHEYDIRNRQRLGQTYGDYTFGNKEIVSMDLDLLKAVYVKEFHHFEDYNFTPPDVSDTQHLWLNTLVFAGGEQWKRIRDRMSPAFSTGKMRRLIPLLRHSVEEISHFVERSIDSQEEIPLQPVMARLSMDMIARSSFAVDIHAFDAEKTSPFMEHAKMFFDYLPGFFTFLIFFPSFILKTRQLLGIDLIKTKPIAFFQGVLERLYDQRKSDPDASKKHNDLFQLMLDANETGDSVDTKKPGPDETKGLSKLEIIAQSVIFMEAGYDTTGNLLHFALYHVAKLPEIQDKLQAEVDEVIGDSEEVTYEHIINMPYLMQVINETLRICPPVFRSGRRCTAPITLKGIPFEKGTNFIMPVHAMHHNSEFYDNPEVFDPERFSPEEKAKRDPMTFVPFGFGPRICLGMRMVEFGTRIALATLLRRYRFYPAKDGPELPLEVVSPKGFGTLKPKRELRVIAERR